MNQATAYDIYDCPIGLKLNSDTKTKKKRSRSRAFEIS
jgi:hypothetical protein